ncbi:carboxypeptidase regulatory-like domain-containing protein [Novipirellula sp.]|uniref:carboxypeptidase regulatory-like domain-containing protein n=1 Tax=Novipirellula sp. TaxID=2795430 RepID=UPI0035683020
MLLTGCGSSSGSYQGTVQFDDGSPVQSGSVEFRSLADGSRYASRIATDGSFSLADQEGRLGCPPGDYEVVVVQIVLTEDLAAEAHEHGRTVPRRFADYYTSGLRVTNDADSTSPLRITLQPSSQSAD